MKDKKSIGLWSAVSIGIGGMIGAGIFSIMGIAVQISGNAVFVSFIIAGFVALFSTYSYAKLGARYPSAGGPVEFLIMGFGDGIFSGGFNILLWIGYVFALSLYAKAFGNYAATFLASNASAVWVDIFATAIIVIFTAINFISAKAVGRSEVIIVAVKVCILILFAAVGVFFIKRSFLSISHWPHTSNIVFGGAIVFLAYEGFGLITNAAEDMNNPRKTLPKALYLSVIIVICIYVSVSLAVVGNLTLPDIIKAKDFALAEAAKPFLGVIGFRLVALAALFSTASAINATLFGGANVSYVIAKEGELPAFFERKVWKRGFEGLVITSALVIVIAIFLNMEGIAMLGSASFLIIYGVVNIAHLRLYRETGARLYIIWVSFLGCAFSFFVLVYYIIAHSPVTLVVLVAALTVSFLVEWVYRKSSKRCLKPRSG
jgi:amino acid transporter